MLNPTDPILTKMIRQAKKEEHKVDKDMNVYVKYNPESKANFEQETVRQRIKIVQNRLNETQENSKLRSILEEEVKSLQSKLSTLGAEQSKSIERQFN